MKLIQNILNQMSQVRKPQKKFIAKALQGFLSISGKLNFSNLSRYVSLSEKTFRRQFVKFFNFTEFNKNLIESATAIKKAKRKAVAFDPFFISKAGSKTDGIGMFWSGVAGAVEQGLEASLLCIVDLDKWTAYALSAKQSPNSEEFKQMKATGSDKNRIDWFAEFIISMIPMFPEEIQHVLVDAYFFKEKFVTQLVENKLHVIGKMRKDAQLKNIFVGEQKKRGPKRKFDGLVNFDQLLDISTDNSTIHLRSTIAYATALDRKILVVLARKKRSDGAIMQALLFTTDLKMTAIDVYDYYRARFQIEFVIRDAKQFAGLNHCQSRDTNKINFHINMSFTAVNIAKIQYLQRQESIDQITSFSIATQHVRNHNEMLIESIFPMLGLDIHAFKSHLNYEKALSYGAIHD